MFFAVVVFLAVHVLTTIVQSTTQRVAPRPGGGVAHDCCQSLYICSSLSRIGLQGGGSGCKGTINSTCKHCHILRDRREPHEETTCFRGCGALNGGGGNKRWCTVFTHLTPVQVHAVEVQHDESAVMDPTRAPNTKFIKS